MPADSRKTLSDHDTALFEELAKHLGQDVEPERPLAGANGARVVKIDSARYVLKSGTNATWKARAARLPRIADFLRSVDYPAAAVMAAGDLPSGRHFLLLELLPGEPLAQTAVGRAHDDIAPEDVELLVNLWRRQLDLAPPRDVFGERWTDYIVEAMFGHDHEWRALAEHGTGDVRALLSSVSSRLKTIGMPDWSGDDFVMGDFGPHNVLASGRQVTGVVDLEEASGRGDAVVDFARLFVRLQRPDLVEVARPVADSFPERLAIAGSYWILNSLDWAVHHERGSAISAAVVRCRTRLDQLLDL